MGKIIRVGVDTSKSVFQLHGVDENEEPVLRRKLRRQQVLTFFARLEPTFVGMESCGGSQYWARELRALGHRVVLVPPQYAKPYVARGKNDAADAEAICEAMSRPKVRKRFVAIKSAEQQAATMLIGVREGLVRRRTQVSNTIRGHAAEFGVVVGKGLAHVGELLEHVANDPTTPELAKEMFVVLAGQYIHLEAQLKEIDARLTALHRGNEQSRRLAEIPSIGPITAVCLCAKVVDPKMFGCGRDFSAWLGLTPKDHSTAGKTRLGVITRAGDEMLRALLINGAMAVIQHIERSKIEPPLWLEQLLARKPKKLAAVALANKTARIAWKLMVSGERYDPRRAASAAARGAGPSVRSGRRNGFWPNKETYQRVWRTADPVRQGRNLHEDVGVIDRSKTRDIPTLPAAQETASLFGARVADTNSVASLAGVKTGHMIASDPLTKSLASRGPSTYGSARLHGRIKSGHPTRYPREAERSARTRCGSAGIEPASPHAELEFRAPSSAESLQTRTAAKPPENATASTNLCDKSVR